jgi:hypothetical protein
MTLGIDKATAAGQTVIYRTLPKELLDKLHDNNKITATKEF